MHETKALLITKNGLRCMLCGGTFPYCQIQWHHVKWRSISKKEGLPPDDSYNNGALLCLNCHAYVHTLYYWSDEYQKTMEKIVANRKP